MPTSASYHRHSLSVSLLILALTLTACSGQNDQGSSAEGGSATASPSQSSTASISFTETKLRDSSGYHLVEPLEGAPTATLYTDLQCPYCKDAEPAYQEAANQLAGQMNVTVRYFPLASHQWAVQSARAVQAAEEQGQHMAMQNKVFAGQDDWAQEEQEQAVFDYFKGYAQELGLDMEKFEADYNSTAVKEIVEEDHRAGQEAGVQGTPQFVVEGKPLEDVDSQTSAADMVEAFKKAANL